MRYNCKVGLPLPVLRCVHLLDLVVSDQGCCDLREFDLSDVLTWTAAITCTKLRKSVSMYTKMLLYNNYGDKGHLQVSSTSHSQRCLRSTSDRG